MKFKVVLADPPWHFKCRSLGGMGRSAENHYQTMSLEDICNLSVADVCEKDAELLLWCTWPHLEAGLKVIQRWGFEYVTGLPWVKMHRATAPRRGMGFHFAQVSEPLLIGKRGKGVCRKDAPNKPLAILFHPPGEHSEKPEDQYLLAEYYPGPYLELFHRPRNGLFPPRENWTFLGNEVTGRDIREDLELICKGVKPG